MTVFTRFSGLRALLAPALLAAALALAAAGLSVWWFNRIL
jgi:hypothetical protein